MEKVNFFMEKFGGIKNMPYLCTKKKIIDMVHFRNHVYVTNPK